MGSLPPGLTDQPGTPPRGVVVVPASVPHIDIHAEVQKFLKAELTDGQTMAILSLKTDTGLNLAIAHKEKVADGFFEGDWIVEGWVGKSGWDKPLAGGIQVMWST
jgi:hypothetical protein